MRRKISLPLALLLGLIIKLHGAGIGTKDTVHKAPEPQKAKDAERRDWPAYEVQFSGVTDGNRSEVKEALFKMGNIEEVSFRAGGVFHITVKDEKKPVWISTLRGAAAKVPGVQFKGYTGLESKEDVRFRASEKTKAEERKAWPLYRVQLHGVSNDNKGDVKAAFLEMGNVDSVSVKADGVVYIIPTDEKSPIWYGSLKAAIAKVPGVEFKGWKGLDESEGSGGKAVESAKSKDREVEKHKTEARKAWPYYRFQITGFDASRWNAVKSALLKVENVSEVSGKKGGVVYITVKDEKQPLRDSVVDAVLSELHGLGMKDFKGCAEKE